MNTSFFQGYLLISVNCLRETLFQKKRKEETTMYFPYPLLYLILIESSFSVCNTKVITLQKLHTCLFIPFGEKKKFVSMNSEVGKNSYLLSIIHF